MGETMTAEELAEMLERASSNGKEITKDDFYNIMVKKTFWWLAHYTIIIIINIHLPTLVFSRNTSTSILIIFINFTIKELQSCKTSKSGTHNFP